MSYNSAFFLARHPSPCSCRNMPWLFSLTFSTPNVVGIMRSKGPLSFYHFQQVREKYSIYFLKNINSNILMCSSKIRSVIFCCWCKQQNHSNHRRIWKIKLTNWNHASCSYSRPNTQALNFLLCQFKKKHTQELLSGTNSQLAKSLTPHHVR